MRNLIKARFVALVLSLGVAPPVAAQTENYVAFMLQEAELGNVTTQLTLGFMYAAGLDVPQNYAEAAKWYRKAADQGNDQAQTELGLMYEKGQGVLQDYVEAAKWYRKGADQGYAHAQWSLGGMYFDGRSVRQDYVEAAKWFRKAADQGHPMAQNLLGDMYFDGQGVPQDYVKAHMLLNLAATGFANTALRNAAVKDRDTVAAKMTKEQIAEAQRLAREWKPK
jgi:hypothetical protein